MESIDDKAVRGLERGRARGIREFEFERYDLGETSFDLPADYRQSLLGYGGAEVLRQINRLLN